MTGATAQTLRPADSAAYRKALRVARERTRAPLTFGGQLNDGAVVLHELVGAHTNALRDLHVRPGRGLGGAVMTTGEPIVLEDYRGSQSITHDYDEFVLGEGIRGIAGVPVLGLRGARGVLYAADRIRMPITSTSLRALRGAAAALANELAIRDEVDRRLELIRTTMDTPCYEGALSVRRAELDELYAELSSIADRLDAGEIRDRLRDACNRFAQLGGERPAATPHGESALLSPRELDVVAEVALGCTNIEAAERLSLRPETVKAYLRSATRKLGVHGRYQAVIAARKRGLLR